jgi:predicted MFS family arabinose efflux permease
LWFAAAIVLIAVFLTWELRSRSPMLNMRYFLDPRFGVAAGVITLQFFAMFGFFFLLTQYFQLVLGYGTLEAGVKQLPFAAVMVVCAPQGPRLAAKFGVNTVVAVGLMMVSAAMALFLLAGPGTAYVEIVPVVMIMAAGMAIAMPSMTGSIMSSVPMGKAGVGSAMNDTTRELGGALGVAVLGSLVASRYSNRLAPVIRSLTGPLRAKAEESLAGALQAAGQVGGPEGQRIAAEARDAFVSGMHLAALVAVCVGVVAAAVVYRLLPSTNPHTHPAVSHTRPDDEPGEDLLAELDGAF